MKVIDRVKAPTPRFFKVLRTIGLMLGLLGGSVLAAPSDAPPVPKVVMDIAGYVALAGGVIGAVSQTAVVQEPDETAGCDDGA